MPKTKASSGKVKKATSTTKKNPSIPSIDSLSAGVKTIPSDVHDDIEDDDEENTADTPSASTPKAQSTLTQAVTRRNLRELFSAEETIIEHIQLPDEGKFKAAHNELKSERMAIFLRVRPFLAPEISRGENQGCFSVLPQAKGIAFNPPKSSHQYRRLANSQDGKVGYEFTQVLGDELMQKEVFDITMSKPIQQFLKGTSQLIFTYGVTNSGKTYTLLGPRHSPGILPRALDRIFSALGPHVSKDSRFRPERYEEVKQLDTEARTEARERRENYLAKKSATAAMKMPENHPLIQISSQGTEGSQSTVDSHGFFDFRPTTESEAMVIQDRDFVDKEATYEVWVSFLEIYEDVAYDLLDLSGSSKATGRVLRSGTLRVMEKGNTCYAQGLIEVPVFSAADAYHIMGLGRKNLHVAATKLNEASSRSHSIFTVKIVKVFNDHKEASVTQLTFCDLAGTERASRTENLGTRLKESQNINKDLHHLKECIEALRKTTAGIKKGKKEIVPFRNCKLTRLFRSFFSGKGTASMIVNISQTASDFDETVQAIRFGSSAMRIMIPMTRRESVLIQAPQFHGKIKITHQNIVSVQLEESMDETIYESGDEDEDTENERVPPTTVKKQPTASKRNLPMANGNKTVVVKKKEPATAVKVSKTPKASATVVKGRKKSPSYPLQEVEGRSLSSTSESSDTGYTDAEASSDMQSVSSGQESERDDEDVEDTVSEADLTIGGAVRGDHPIEDYFWQDSCPYPEFIHEEDHRVRGLLLLLNSCQQQIKQSRALNMANEMKVRKELCDYYDKERERHNKEHEKAIRRREAQFEDDLHKQLSMLKEGMERKFQERGDPSMMSFEKHEIDMDRNILHEEVAKLQEKVADLEDRLGRRDDKIFDLKARLARSQ